MKLAMRSTAAAAGFVEVLRFRPRIVATSFVSSSRRGLASSAQSTAHPGIIDSSVAIISVPFGQFSSAREPFSLRSESVWKVSPAQDGS